MIKNIKSHHIIYIIMSIILVAGIGTGVYFYIKNKSNSPNVTPTDCKKGQNICRDDQGQSTCCDFDCCEKGKGLGIGVCLTSDQQCVNNKPCDDQYVCKHDNSDKTICCSDDKPNCNTASGTCNNCTKETPECGGKVGTAATCCKPDKCYDKNENKTSDNPCVCCNGNRGGVQGMGGTCCSKNRCLCPGEYYGGKDISGDASNKRTRKPDGTCALNDGKPKCINSEDINSGELANVARDDVGEICDINNIYYNSSTKQWLCCNNTIYWDPTAKPPSGLGKGALNCCSEPNAKVGNSSICYSDNQRSDISKDSPLYGMCSGIDDSSLQVDVCVNTNNFNKSTFSKPKNDNTCTSPEQVVTLPYYELINQPGIISYLDKGGNTTIEYPQTLSNKKITDISQLNTFTGKQCSKNSDCVNKTSGGCVDKNGNPIVVKGIQITNCDASKGQYPSGSCGSGCPANNPTTICGEGEICYTYEGKNSDGSKYTSGFCGKLPSTTCQQKPGSQQMPEHLQTMDATGNSALHYNNLNDCQKFCETKRGGYCLAGGDEQYYCYLPTCTDGKANYIVQGAANMTSKNIITFDNPSGTTTCSMADCMLLQNKQHVKDISYDENTCTANFDCSTMLVKDTEVQDTYIYGKNAENSGFKGENLYDRSGQKYTFQNATPFGPYSFTSLSDRSCVNGSTDPTGKYCNKGNTCNNGTCSTETPAGVY